MMNFDFDPDEYDEAEVMREVQSPDKLARAGAIYRLGRKCFDEGRPGKGAAHLETAYELCVELGNLHGQRECLSGLGWMLSIENRPKESAKWYGKLAELAVSDLDSSGELFATMWQAQQYRRMKDWAMVNELLSAVEPLAVELGHVTLPGVQSMLARSLRKLGRLEESEAMFAKALESYEASDEHLLPFAENDYALTLLEMGRAEKALEVASEALLLATFDGNEYVQSKFEYTVARCLNVLGRFEEALTHLDAIRDRFAPGKRRKHKMKIDIERVKALKGLERVKDASDLLPGIIAAAKSIKSKSHEAEARVLYADCYRENGNYLDAREQLISALNLVSDSADLATANDIRLDLSMIYGWLEQNQERLAMLHAIADNPLSIASETFGIAVCELAVEYAGCGEVERAQSYLAACKNLPKQIRTDFVLGYEFETEGLLHKLAGSKTKASNAFAKAMQKYLLAGHYTRADAVARLAI